MPIVNQYDQQQLHQQEVSQSFDPYLQLNAPAAPPNPKDTHARIEMVNHTFSDVNADDNHEEEEFYMQMTPTTSVENVQNEHSSSDIRQHKKVALTRSYEPQSSNAPRRMSEQRRSMPYGGSKDEEQEIYYNKEFQEDEQSQENYVVMELSERNEPEEYLAPSDIMMQISQQDDDEGGQELYMEMDHQPPVPRKGVVLPAAAPTSRQHDQRQNANRKETLDNQYVKITGQDKKLKKSFLSNEQLAPQYVNVQRDGDPRLRSVTSPAMSAVQPPVKKVEFEFDEQPIYQNFSPEDDDESYYGNVS